MGMLYEDLNSTFVKGDIDNIKTNIIQNPDFDIKGLNPKFQLRDYQIDAIARLKFIFTKKPFLPIHLLFNMATGSGKTLLMAQNILYLYQQGYRNFIFFVHQNVILNKTKENFFNKNNRKYLFNKDLIYNSQRVRIREVTNFEEANNTDINILFTTIQGLHDKITTPHENSINMASLADKKIVMIADEAHHLNSKTKQSGQMNFEDETDRISWEDSVENILNLSNENILLEYTATINLEDNNIKAKYENKLVKKYGLKEFRDEKYSKDIYLIKSELSSFQRILLALVLSYYREQVASDNKINLKPIILVKSAAIKNSESDKENFVENLKYLSSTDIDNILGLNDERVLKASSYFKRTNITSENICNYLKLSYNENTIRVVNSGEGENKKAQCLKEMNELEDENNNIRLIFSVQMLNEGWDVLNLYDIVRLDESNKKEAKKVESDVQLIGRGCRYYPFATDATENKFTRKYDNDLNNDLRCLEEFYYHSKLNNKYIESLKDYMAKEGLTLNDSDDIKKVKIKLKNSFKESSTYKNGLILENKQIKRDFSLIKSLADYKVPNSFDAEMATNKVVSENILSRNKDTANIKTEIINIKPKIWQKAIDLNNFYYFNNFKKIIPSYSSINQLIQELSQLEINIINVPLDAKELILQPKEQLEIAQNILKKIEKIIKDNTYEYAGSTEFSNVIPLKQKLGKILDENNCYIQSYKKSTITSDSNGEGHSISVAENNGIRMDLKSKEHDWYVFDDFYGTAEEKSLIRFIGTSIQELSEKYDEVFLIRNQNLCKVWLFGNGKGFEPDFLLFLKDQSKILNYQIFIEPKGSKLSEAFDEQLKQEFLMSPVLNKTVSVQDKQYRLIGLPFYNNENKEMLNYFKNEYKERIL